LQKFDLLLLLAVAAQVLNVLKEFLDLGISISSSSSSLLLRGFLTATNKEYQKVTLLSNLDSFPPMQIDKISHIVVRLCQ
jgi:hypothetical protein